MAGRVFCNRTALVESMHQAGFDALIAVTPTNVTYTSSLDLYTQTLIPDRMVITLTNADGASHLVIWSGESDKVERDAQVASVSYYAEFGQSPVTTLVETLIQQGLQRGRIGVELRFFPVAAFQELIRLLPEAHVADCEEVFAEARMIKTADEIVLLHRMAWVMDRAAQLAAGLARPDETERVFAGRIVANLLTLMEEEVAGPDGIVAAGPNALVMHHLSDHRSIRRGEMLRYGAKCSVLGYWCIILRMAAMGEATPQQIDAYARFADIYQSTLELLKPGMRACDVYAACQRHVERHGMRLISEKVGHGTGLAFREPPILQPADQRVLQPNMVLAYDYLVLDQHGAPFHIEDRVLVTEKGPVILSDVADTRTLAILG
ncbi:M24 family metallopeptidase [Roseiflexus sp.]|uniref:M24 family metallopeptidase n=1 Tax=Roseiflexus sp. TaxID=2562120 RepID=UPI0021DC310D|nr:M24 family metallopeptidase [Roseiflexus sp.]GIV52941.1 MAG: peptidase M24 [Candidatus Kapabacteria bacterium]GIW01911.1 MAG: peptidase M24 [Roseiflexus sp.]